MASLALRRARLLTRPAHIARRGFFTIVQQGQEGWRLSFGRNPEKLTPGLWLAIPIYHTVNHVDMRETSVGINDLTGFTSDNTPVMISGSLFFRITDSYNACFKISEVQKNIRNIGTSAMRSVVGHFSYDEVIADRNKINQRLHDVIGSSIEKWGVQCTRFEIQTFKPSNRDVERQLELQMEAERNRRKQILDTQAAVNVAEGQKQKTILQSEGELQSQVNHAEGSKKTLILESEGRLESARNEALAIAQQVELIAASLGPNPTAKERESALQVLLELKRLEQLKAIAGGKGNNTYFFGTAKGTPKDDYEVDNVERWKRSLTNEKVGATVATSAPSHSQVVPVSMPTTP